MNHSQNEEKPIEIPPGQLSEQALAGIIENFIVREGTDYGAVELSFATKAEQIRRQIDSGEIRIIFDQATESIGLLPDRDFKRLNKAQN